MCDLILMRKELGDVAELLKIWCDNYGKAYATATVCDGKVSAYIDTDDPHYDDLEYVRREKKESEKPPWE